MQKEVAWNLDLIDLLRIELKSEFLEYQVIKGKILKDIFLSNDEGYGNSLQFGFVDQDIIIYKETMDVSDFKQVKNIFLHNINISSTNDTQIFQKVLT